MCLVLVNLSLVFHSRHAESAAKIPAIVQRENFFSRECSSPAESTLERLAHVHLGGGFSRAAVWESQIVSSSPSQPVWAPGDFWAWAQVQLLASREGAMPLLSGWLQGCSWCFSPALFPWISMEEIESVFNWWLPSPSGSWPGRILAKGLLLLGWLGWWCGRNGEVSACSRAVLWLGFLV